MRRSFFNTGLAAALAVALIGLASTAGAQCAGHVPLIVAPGAGPFPYTNTHNFTGTESNTINFVSEAVCFPFGSDTDEPEAVWQFAPATTGTYMIDTIGSTVQSTFGDQDTKLWVMTNCADPINTDVACNEDISGANFLSAVSVVLNSGTTYFIAVEPFNNGWTAGQTIVLNITFAAGVSNDTCATATAATPLPFFESTNNGGAAADQAADVTCPFGGNGPDIFYSLNVVTPGAYRLTGAGPDLINEWRSGACPGAIVACRDDFVAGGESLVATLAAGGHIGHLLSFDGASTGAIDVAIDGPLPAALPNNDCPTALALTIGSPVTENYAGSEDNVHGGLLTASPEAWYQFTAPALDDYTFTVNASADPNHDPVVVPLNTGCTGILPGSTDATGAGGTEMMTVTIAAAANIKVLVEDFNLLGGGHTISVAGSADVSDWKAY